ncbi:hypothetical protein [Grimontia sp. NTOU-MAR1]|uniref:hypothetical protein n=1 Tax=Grimontia sp. NTOU-MAR1 TaxID=3111011 RepID=UPI002DBAA748|nr:hypothetical protein [Grimontia sp. NTOU-MAR1]WRW00254.1 hypothetical protein VP504_25080 [Grimontia sp. NTOU-MAR1]
MTSSKVYFSRYCRHLFVPLLFLGLVACSDNNSSSSAPPSSTSTSLSGLVSAPSNNLVNFRKPTLFDVVFPPAYAAVVGLVPVNNGEVELIRVDDDGNQIGEVITTAQISRTGRYDLSLPSGVSLAGNLVVRVRGQQVEMNAIAIEQKVDINPISHYIFQNLVDSDLVISDLAENQVVSLRGVIDELDLTAGDNLAETLAALDEVAGFRIDQEISVLAKAPGDASLFDGSWRYSIFDVSLHDTDDGTGGTFSTSMEIGHLSIASPDADSLSITVEAFEDNFGLISQYNSGQGIVSSLFTETETSNNPETPEVLDVNVTADGTLIERLGFDEHFGYDQGDGPVFGFRTLPATFVLEPGGSDDVKLGINQEVTLRFLTVDTNNDGKFDAVDPNQKVGDEPSMAFDLMVKSGTNMTNDILDGNVGIVGLELLLDSTTSTTEVITESRVLGFDGAGNFDTVASSAFSSEMKSTPMSVTFNDSPTIGNFSGTYNVGETGDLNLTSDGNTLVGFSSASGDLLTFATVEQNENQGQIVEYVQLMALGLSLGDTPPSIAGATYKLYPLEIGFGSGGGTEVLTFANPGTLTIGSSGNEGTLAGKTLGMLRNSTLEQVRPVNEETESVQVSVDVTANSVVSIEQNDGSFSLELDGYVSGDGSRMLLSLKALSDEGTQDAYYGLGFVLAVKEP